jgi:hypothetical protein
LWFAYAIKFFDWCSRYKDAGVLFRERLALYAHIANTYRLQEQPIDYLEFGVSKGQSLQWWVNHNSHPDSRFVGFDTFRGIPEAWGWFPKGSFTTDGHLPAINDQRVEYQVGLFQETLGNFLEKFSSARQAVVHLDADLYSSTLFVLCSLGYRLKPGDIVIFDEVGTRYGFTQEFRALCDFVSAYGHTYKFIGGARHYMQIAIEITSGKE